LSNTLKSRSGRLEALHDPAIMARRVDAERSFREAIAADAELAGRWGTLHERMAEVQRAKMRLAGPFTAFTRLGDPATEAAALRRALRAAELLAARAAGVSADTLE